MSNQKITIYCTLLNFQLFFPENVIILERLKPFQETCYSPSEVFYFHCDYSCIRKGKQFISMVLKWAIALPSSSPVCEIVSLKPKCQVHVSRRFSAIPNHTSPHFLSVSSSFYQVLPITLLHYDMLRSSHLPQHSKNAAR